MRLLLPTRRLARALPLVTTLALLLALLMPGQAVLAAPLAGVSPNLPAEVFIGEDFSFTVSFDNTGDQTGYGPFVDLLIPQLGTDGAGVAVDDGITFNGATYLGANVTSVVQTFPALGCVDHPYAKDAAGVFLQVCGTPGDQLVTLQLPFGSFTVDQPAVDINISASLSDQADFNTPLIIKARGGYQYGNTPLDDWCCGDPAIVTPPSTNGTGWPQDSLTPIVLKLTKQYIGPEDETATGPNFPRQYLITVDIADGQTLTNLDLTDILPTNEQFVQVDATTIRGAATATTAVATPSTTVPGGTLTRRFASVTGTTAANDATMLFTFFVPRLDAASAVIIDAVSGDDVTSLNNARTSGSWTPIDIRDSATTTTIDPVGPEHTLTDKSIAVQKGVAVVADTGAAGPSPGDTLEYTVDFQVSDYFAFQNIVLTDRFSDGQRYDPTFTPRFGFNEHTNTSASVAFNATNFTVDTSQIGNSGPNPPADGTDGSTTITFRVSNEMVTRAFDGKLIGGGIPTAGTGAGALPNNPPLPFGATTARIIFRTVIQENFSDTYPSGDASVDEGDTLANTITIRGELLAVNDVSTPTGQFEEDTSFAGVKIVRGAISKSIYALNGNTAFTTPVIVTPGDTVTYRLQVDLPTSDIENLTLIDYLPLPVFSAAEVTSFSTAASATPPPAGTARLGPSDSFFGVSAVVPTLSTNTPNNTLTFDYGDYDNVGSVSSSIDILFTVTVSNQPFADDLFLTNQLRRTQGATNEPESADDAIVQIKLTEPLLISTKGVISTNKTGVTFTPATVGPVAFNAPGTAGNRWAGTITPLGLETTPIDSNLSGVDAGDLVSFAITIQNNGLSSKGAFDITINDTLPAGFIIPPAGAGLNLRVAYGDNAGLTYTNVGTGLFDAAGGIRIDDPAGEGACQGKLATNQSHRVIVITYDLQVDPSAQPGQALVNTGTLTNYAGAEGGPDHTPTDPADDPTDTASVTVATLVASTKAVQSTSEGSTSEAGIGTTGNPRLATIGEVLRYRLTARIPEGTTSNFRAVDLLPNGLRFIDDNTARVAFVAEGAGISSSTLGAAPQATGDETTVAAVAVTSLLPDNAVSSADSTVVANYTANDNDTYNSGTDIFFKLGDLTNSDNDTDFEFVVIEFNALVENSAGNNAGDNRDNSFAVRQAASGTNVNTSGTYRVRLVEPQLTISKTANPTTADASDTVEYTIVVANNGGAGNRTTAFDVSLSDTLPAELTNLVLVSTNSTNGATGIVSTLTGANLTVTAISMPDTATITVVVRGDLVNTVSSGQVINNTATVLYTSLPGSNGTGSATPGAPGSATGERDGSLTPAHNDNRASDTEPVMVFLPVPLKNVVATSEAHTTANNVAIGEVVRYRLAVRLAEGSATDFAFRDNLPPGLRFLNDGTARFVFVSDNTTGIASSVAAVDACADLAAAPATPLGCTFPAAQISGGTGAAGSFQAGDDPLFSFGNLTNSDNDANDENVVLEFNALVENIAGNQAATSLPNTFTMVINTADIASSVSEADDTLTVVEPTVSISKAIVTNLTDAGDSITYDLTITNAAGANSATAFEIDISDTLDNDLELLATGDVSLQSGPGYLTFTNASATPASVAGRLNRLDPGDTAVVRINARVRASASAGETTSNNASLVYTSLPGTGTAPNPTLSVTPAAGERDGSGGTNDYTATSGTVSSTLPDPTIDKLTLSDTTYTIGEPVAFYLHITLPEGVSENMQVVDALPPGLTPLSYEIITSGASSGTTPAVTVNFNGSGLTAGTTPVAGATDGQDVTITLGDLTTTDDNLATNNSFLIKIDAFVSNTAAMQAGTILTNQATLAFRRPDPSTTTNPATGTTVTSGDSTTITVVEPVLTIAKSVTPALADPGDLVTFQIVVSNPAATGSPSAYDVQVSDTLPAELTYEPGSIRILAGSPAGTSDDSAAPALGWSFPAIAPGETATLEFDARIAGSGSTTPIVNTASQAWTTRPGTDPNERTGTGGVNDLTNSDDASLLTAGTVGNQVWFDRNANGLQDGGDETGINGVTVRLYTGAGVLQGTQVTANLAGTDGIYRFDGLAAGNYYVEFDLPTGYRRSPADVGGDDTIDSDANATLQTVTFALGVGASDTSRDLGIYQALSLGQLVWHDRNNNGVYEPAAGETGIDGVTVQLFRAGDDPTSATPLDQQVTAGGGVYIFANLDPGSYFVYIATPPAATPVSSTTTDTADNGQDGDDNGSQASPGAPLQSPNIELASGREPDTAVDGDNTNGDLTLDFGLFAPVSLGDYVWVDQNRDGIQDGGEPGLAGVTVTLYQADGTTLVTTDLSGNPITPIVTPASGAYGFSNLPPGQYVVTFGNQPAGYQPTIVNASGATTTNDSNGLTATSALLASGASDTTLDSGFFQPLALGNLVFYDTNRNGSYDAGDVPLPGASVALFASDGTTPATDANGNPLAAQVTGANGQYLFSNLAPGGYVVQVTAPAGYRSANDSANTANPENSIDSDDNGIGINNSPASGVITLASDSEPTTDGDGNNGNLTLDFAFVGTGSLGDTIWFDANNDGTQDTGEPGISGLTVTVLWAGPDNAFGTADDAAITSAPTAADGVYGVAGLPPGNYTVSVNPAGLPAGLTPGYDLDGGNDATTDTTLNAGQDRDTVDFGYTGVRALGDRVWFDFDADGVQDAGEPGIYGVDLTVTWFGQDASFGTADDVAFSATTIADGAYSVNGLPAGSYRVSVVAASLPNGLTQTYDLDGGNDNTADGSLSAAADNLTFDFGYRGSGSIGDRVWNDLNGDGLQDAGEPGLPNVDMSLTWAGPDGDFAASADNISLLATTDANGNYLFDNLPPGEYRVDVDDSDAPVGTTLTTTDPQPVSLGDGQDYLNADFGFSGVGTLGDRLWLDQDGDGVQDASEPGIPGANVALLWAGPNGTFGDGDDITYPARATDANGFYRFTNLQPGNYRATVDPASLPFGYQPTYDLDGANDNQAEAALGVGESRRDVDFGYSDPAPATNGALGDRVWLDTDGDGVQDAGENGIDGVVVTLTRPGPDGLFGTPDDVSSTSTTSGGGLYLITNLGAGSYRVSVDLAGAALAGMVSTYDLDGTPNGSTIAGLASGEVRDDVDFGFRALSAGGSAGSIGDRVWLDQDGDGLQDAAEAGIPNLTLTLTGTGPDGQFGTADDTSANATTDTNGNYSFTGLPAGSYRVTIDKVSLPAGLYSTYELDASRDGQVLLTLAPGEARSDADFGYRSDPPPVGTGAVGDRVWLDQDGDGVQDAGEPGLVGVTVRLTAAGADNTFGTADDLSYTTVTGNDGSYGFSSLPPGDYQATIDKASLPAGLQLSYDLDGGLDGTATVSLAAGQTRLDLDFGYQGTGSLGDRVWRDSDADRVQDSAEAGIPNVVLQLTTPGADGLFGTADDISSTTTTDAAGFYRFSGLPAGDYRVTLDPTSLPGGLSQTYDLDGSLDDRSLVSLAAGEVRLDVDFGYTDGVPGTAALGDRVWLDLDGDGVQDLGEPGLVGITVQLIAAGPDNTFGTSDDIVNQQITGTDGAYRFDGLPAGDYRVTVDSGSLPGGLTATGERDGTLDGSVDVTLAAGDNQTDIDFGYQGTGSIGDRVWLDLDADGVQDAGEPGLPNVSITLVWFGADGVLGGGDDITLTTTTDVDGIYGFDGLPFGPDLVVVGTGLPGGVEATSELDSTLDGQTTADLTTTAPGRTDVDYGFTGTGSISRRVWDDEDRDGVFDPGEAGIPGVTIVVVWDGPDGIPGTADDLTIIAVTRPDGTYQVPNLPAGEYTVTVDITTLPRGMQPTYDRDGGDDSTTTVPLAPGQTVPDIDFGFALPPTAISLLAFNAERLPDGLVHLRWATAAEVNTLGFHVLRSSNGTRASAQRVTARLIMAKGRGGAGASYNWVDQTAQPGVSYSYWLEETETSGTTSVYGPAHAPLSGVVVRRLIYLPVVVR